MEIIYIEGLGNLATKNRFLRKLPQPVYNKILMHLVGGVGASRYVHPFALGKQRFSADLSPE
jgi:hypothetical protein